jgi:hypothetical protein
MWIFKLDARPAIAHPDIEPIESRGLQLYQHLAGARLRGVKIGIFEDFKAAVFP